MSRLTVTADVMGAEGARSVTVKGQTAKALLALVDAGNRGCTALEVASWAFRFAAYTHELRTLHGISIRTDREPHAGGWHGRHVLESQVTVTAISEGERGLPRASSSGEVHHARAP